MQFESQNPPKRIASVWTEIAWIAALCAFGLAARAWVYVRMEDVLHADSAVQGLIARHILGGEIQIFTYGIAHHGTLQAHWIALCFALFGQSTFVLKWAAGVESLGLIVAAYLLGREIGGDDRRIGRLAALLTAIGPLYLVEWSLRPRGGHIQVAILSALALWMTLRACRLAGPGEADPSALPLKIARRWLALAAFVLGVSWWSQFTTIYAILTCLLVFLWRGGPLRRDPRVWSFAAAAFLIGSLPFWLYNIKFRWASFREISGGGGGPGLLHVLPQRMRGLVAAIAILVGARQTEAFQSFGAVQCLLAALGYGALLLATSVAPPRGEVKRNSSAIGWIFLAVTLMVYLATSFSSYALEPRYLLPVYAILGPLTATGAIGLWDRKGAMRCASALLVLLVLWVSLHGCWRGERNVMQPWGAERRIPADFSPLIRFLDSHGITRVFTNFYVGYRLDFETHERILACTDGDPIPELYTPYRDAVKSAEPPAAFITGPQAAWWLNQALQSKRISFRHELIEGFEVFYDLGAPFVEYPLGANLTVPLTVEVGSYATQCRPGERFPVEITAKNQSLVAWPLPPHPNAVQLSYHLLKSKTGRMVRFNNPRFSLGREVRVGDATTVTMTIEAPTEPGHYAFVPDLVVEGVAWLSSYQGELVAKKAWCNFTVAP